MTGCTQGDAALAARFVADMPTITISRLKAWLTVSGGSVVPPARCTLTCTRRLPPTCSPPARWQASSAVGFVRVACPRSRPVRAPKGCLPTFLDIGQSFSAVTLTEDNLLSQLAAHGKRTVSARRAERASSARQLKGRALQVSRIAAPALRPHLLEVP